MTWQPGQSGNRNGRPRGSAGVASYIRSQCGDDLHELIDRLLQLSRDPACPIRERLGATQHLIDRAIGRPLATEVQLQIREQHALPADWHLLSTDDKARWLDADSQLALDTGETLTEDGDQ